MENKLSLTLRTLIIEHSSGVTLMFKMKEFPNEKILTNSIADYKRLENLDKNQESSNIK